MEIFQIRIIMASPPSIGLFQANYETTEVRLNLVMMECHAIKHTQISETITLFFLAIASNQYRSMSLLVFVKLKVIPLK